MDVHLNVEVVTEQSLVPDINMLATSKGFQVASSCSTMDK